MRLTAISELLKRQQLQPGRVCDEQDYEKHSLDRLQLKLHLDHVEEQHVEEQQVAKAH